MLYYIILYYIILYYIILYTSPCLLNLIWILNSKIWINFNMQKLIYRLSWRGQLKQTPCMCINSRYTSSAKDSNPETVQCLQEMKPQTFVVYSEGETAHWHVLLILFYFIYLFYCYYLLLHITSADFSDVIFFHALCLLFNTLYTYMYILILIHCGVVDSGWFST